MKIIEFIKIPLLGGKKVHVVVNKPIPNRVEVHVLCLNHFLTTLEPRVNLLYR